MSIQKEDVFVNDYLDLYLYAGKIGDKLWQEEIIQKLKQRNNETPEPKLTRDKSHLTRYKQLNEDIRSIYNQSGNQPTNDELQEKLLKLKQQRVLLGRKINLLDSQTSEKN